MIRNTKIAILATSALVGSLLLATNAMAQSTGTTAVEEVTITATRGPRNIDGAAVAEVEPKSRASITQEFISTQVPGQTILDSINLMPGVNFTNNDAYGSAGGDLVLRGFDSQRVALLQDGIPLNDSGNYAVYPNQQLDSELIERVTVNLGTTDVDSPTAASAGGTINYVTRKPSKTMGLRIETGVGEDGFRRLFGVVETGEVGPYGTRAWFSAHYAKNDIFNGPGQIEKVQYNARVHQDLANGDYLSLIFNYNENRNTFYRRGTVAQFNAHTIPSYESFCNRPAPGPGVQNEATTGTGFTAGPPAGSPAGSGCTSNFYGNNINPSNTGNIRGQSKFHLGDNLILTVDPSFQYVLANGGGRTIFAENDPQMGAGGVDLNGDGDKVDRLLVYWPNTTNTRRYGVNSSLIWTFAENQNVRLAYTYDRARHRQTGEASRFDPSGFPDDVFGGKDGYGQPIVTATGQILRRRDRLSVAILNQIAFEYRGRFLEDRLLINAGVRAPFFKRELNNFCYQRDTFQAFCPSSTMVPVAVVGSDDGNGQTLVTFPGAFTGAPFSTTVSQITNATTQFGRPRQFTKKYDKVLPNIGVSYEFLENHTVYASYAETISAPRTDDLYDKNLPNPKAEIGKAVDLGYRYQTPTLLVSGAIWANRFSNRVERVSDDASGIFFSQNVGDVHLWGADGQIAYKPIETITLYGSASYLDTEIQENIPNGLGFYATKGKQLYETPKTQFAGRVSWDATDYLRLGLQAKAIGSRFTNLENTEKVKGYTLADLDVRLNLSKVPGLGEVIGLDHTYLQLNVKNLFDKYYAGDLVNNIQGPGQVSLGYPRTTVLTLHVEF